MVEEKNNIVNETNSNNNINKDNKDKLNQELDYYNIISSLFSENYKNNKDELEVYINKQVKTKNLIENYNKNINEIIGKIVPICLDSCVVSRQELNKYKAKGEREEFPNFNSSETELCLNKCLLKGKYAYNSILNKKDLFL